MGGIVALLVAAGRGRRFGADLPKQYHTLKGQAVLRHTAQAFLKHPEISAVRVVIGPDDQAFHDLALVNLPVLPPIVGGKTRQESVRLGLESFKTDCAEKHPDIVLIHDGARPLIDQESISRVLESVRSGRPAIAAMPVVDTLKKGAPSESYEEILSTIDRTSLWRAQTPQGFSYQEILSAHQKALQENRSDLTDDAAVLENAGQKVFMVLGHDHNIKITAPADLIRADEILTLRTLSQKTQDAAQPLFRCGKGFDVHAFEAGSSVRICGVDIPHSHKLSGHSDADVAMHALTDALLGAIAAGDIGTHFPPSDMRWKGADSEQFLRHAADLVSVRGGQIVNIDLTVICERPKMGPHRPSMIARLADILNLRPDQVSVKATTTEKLGFTGRQEGIAAEAVVNILVMEPV